MLKPIGRIPANGMRCRWLFNFSRRVHYHLPAIRSNRGVVREDRDFIYLLYPLEVYHEQDIAPLDRIREHAARFILHQRELELLEQIKKEIYDRDIQNERVKIYTE